MKEIIKNNVIYAKVLEINKNTYAIYLKDKELETIDCIKYTLENRQRTITLLKNNKNKLINTILNQITITLISLSLFIIGIFSITFYYGSFNTFFKTLTIILSLSYFPANFIVFSKYLFYSTSLIKSYRKLSKNELVDEDREKLFETLTFSKREINNIYTDKIINIDDIYKTVYINKDYQRKKTNKEQGKILVLKK